jgi:Na+-translocating ferredoxin:NAD+ oxidoreductase RnfD subunit
MTLDPFVATGILGTALIVAAYFANQSGKLPSDDRRYPLANLVGSLMILASFYSAWNLPAALIEVLWAAVSLYGLLRRRAG